MAGRNTPNAGGGGGRPSSPQTGQRGCGEIHAAYRTEGWVYAPSFLRDSDPALRYYVDTGYRGAYLYYSLLAVSGAF
jgi:hypothetical protein